MKIHYIPDEILSWKTFTWNSWKWLKKNRTEIDYMESMMHSISIFILVYLQSEFRSVDKYWFWLSENSHWYSEIGLYIISHFFFSIPSGIREALSRAPRVCGKLKRFSCFLQMLYNVIIVLIANKFRPVCQNENKQVFGAITINKYATFIFMFIYIFILFRLNAGVGVFGCLLVCVFFFDFKGLKLSLKAISCNRYARIDSTGYQFIAGAICAEPETLNK